MPQSRFIEPLICFIEDNLNIEEHLFVIINYSDNDYHVSNRSNVLRVSSIFLSLMKVDYKFSDKIILHGLFKFTPLFFYFKRNLLKKVYWIIWGGDLYRYRVANDNVYNKLYEYIRIKVISRIKNFIVYMDEEFELLQKVYKSNGRHFKSFVYLSNLYHEVPNSNDAAKNYINILVGNSGISTNNHILILDQLLKYKDKNIKIIAPLSYGDDEYIKKISEYGTNLFQSKFYPILDYIEYDKYIELLSSIDIAIFNHDRQQAIGNTNVLIGMGVKVYLHKNTSQWNFYESKNIIVYDNMSINLNKIKSNIVLNNKKKLQELFSKEALKVQLEEIFNA